ncbi:M28 family peptidase [Brevibacillus fluminis]|uniref:M28 family peptidase n=1 Tax=Brevibacillus fluminis TaxID=511487 RepID=A0A3M8DWP9_9BACL|nr:M20/M25/M40 family metallo-hydrolase [Brevibacillus fluminis]RNB92522.1 M28 family peptidase [Brevibacillus fluminis]
MNNISLLTRYGFKPSDLENWVPFRLSHASELLTLTLTHLGTTYDLLDQVSEQTWVEALRLTSFQVERRGGECLVNPLEKELPLADIDLYMRGITRWMNELGIHTAYCCDGHERKNPKVILLTHPNHKQITLLKASAPEEMNIRFSGKEIHFECNHQRELLLLLAEKLYAICADPAALIRYEADHFKHSLIELLNIPGESGYEDPIRRFLKRKLKPITDNMFVDRAGNVCAFVFCGQGPTILLSAHMDIFQELEESRQIVQEGTTLYSTSGILGADDRAGIAVILEIIKNIHQTNFNGTLKIAFTVGEEIGLIGSQQLDPMFLYDIDSAIVVDRRGNRDIVTSYAGIIPFCPDSYGLLFEQAGALAGMEDWKVTEGGSSDAKVFFQKFGIPSVNLSVGYQHEHTERETVDYFATFQTATLILTLLHHQLIRSRDKMKN